MARMWEREMEVYEVLEVPAGTLALAWSILEIWLSLNRKTYLWFDLIRKGCRGPGKCLL